MRGLRSHLPALCVPVLCLLASTVAAAGALRAQMDADWAQRRDHWSWQPLADAAPPAVRDAGWVRDPLDAFVLARLEQAGLEPAPPAPPEVWLRRVWFDVTGLPPTPAAVRAFVADPSDRARARVVDELLASPHFGERWGRHWLDLVRYAESMGHEYDFRIPNAWRYRDYVVRAINADVPFDQFAREHVAGDLLPQPRVDPATGRNESVHGTAFWWFCEQTHSPVDAAQHQADRIDNQIDVLTKTFLGTTVACARCHDHKFDAIRSADYYALYGFLKSSRYVQQPTHETPPAAAARALVAHRRLARLVPRDAAALAAPDDALRDGDQLLADFGADAFGGGDGPATSGRWRHVGDGVEPAPWRGPFVEAVDGATVRCRELAGGWALSAARGVGRNAVLHSPTFVIDDRYLHLEVAGRGARVLVVVEGLHLVRDPIYGELRREIARPRPHWLTFDLGMWRGRRAHVQVLDQRCHDLADAERGTDRYPADAWFGVRRLLTSTHRRAPRATAAHRCVDLWAGTPAAAAAAAEFVAATAALPEPTTVPGTTDGTSEDEHVFLRGSHKMKGDLAPRRFLEAVAGDAALPIRVGSGRLQLAEAMFAPDDPLPARVLANRVWHRLFGRGLARTVDNLGHLGEAPTHPLLLDRLALDLMQGGWSRKQLLRRVLLSQTYAMHSLADAAADARDPKNDLLHRQNLRRLEGEAVRDALLVFADRLDARLGGPPVALALDDDDKARGKPKDSGPVDGDGRRSIYLALQRNFLPDFLVAFDLPQPFSTVGARNVSNVPAQSLALLNDPFVHAMCERAAGLLLARGPDAPEDRVAQWFLAAFARPPDQREVALCLQFVTQVARDAGPADAEPAEAGAWAALAHALVNKKEFLFLR